MNNDYDDKDLRDTRKEKAFFVEETSAKVFDFYGVDMNAFKLGERVWEATEDEDDGYRSLLESVVVKDSTGLIFFSTPIAHVRVVREESADEYDEIYTLVDESDGHIWLTFGTRFYDEYYPTFTFYYSAKGE